MPKKTEEIKVRVEPIEKLALKQIADSERLDLSDIVRRALGEFVRKQSIRAGTNRPSRDLSATRTRSYAHS